MSTLHLVDPAYRQLASEWPPFTPSPASLAQFRADVAAAFAAPPPIVPEERFVSGATGEPDVRVLVYRPESPGPASPAVLYFYGGGFIAGAPETMDPSILSFLVENGAVVVAVGYRHAPETPFPGPVEDCYAALGWLSGQARSLGIDSARIAVLGDSAGGGLAAALALLARDRGEFALKAQLLIYPMLDCRTGMPEAPRDNATTGEFVWTRQANRFGWEAMRGSVPIARERLGHFSPALATDLSGLPATFISVGSIDLFLDEDVTYAMRLSAAGTPVELHVYDGAFHGINRLPGRFAERFNADLRDALSRLLLTTRADQAA